MRSERRNYASTELYIEALESKLESIRKLIEMWEAKHAIVGWPDEGQLGQCITELKATLTGGTNDG